jgi:transposase-like protein
LTPKEEFEQAVKRDVQARVREGVKAVLEEVLQEEMTEHLEAGYRELTPTRRGERNGPYTRNLVTPAGKIERLEVPRDREGEFVTEVFERYKRMTGDVEEAVLEMYLSGISVRKIAGVTDSLSRVKIGKDAVSRIASRLEEEQKQWPERPLGEKEYPYLYLDATYLKVRWGASVTSMALLACVGVDEEGFREVLAVEVAGSEKGAAYASLVRGLLDRGLSGVRLVVSDDHEGIKAAVAGELPGVEWQRCVAHVPARCAGGSGRGPQGDLQGQAPEDRAGPGRGIREPLRRAIPESDLGLGDRHSRRSCLPALPWLPPREVTHDEHAGEALQGGEAEDEGDRSFPERDERDKPGDGDNLEEQ